MKMIKYELLADLFLYPSDEVKSKILEVKSYIKENFPNLSDCMGGFTDVIQKISLSDWEEIYTRTFDVQAVTTLDVGYVLFGDDYKRGELLVNLNKEHKKAGNNCGTELADHLPNVLRLLDKIEEDSLKEDLTNFILIPALNKIISEFNKDKLTAKENIYKKHHQTIIEQDNSTRLIYQKALKVVLELMKIEFPTRLESAPAEGGFSVKISNELEIKS
jgi:nitrate reductase molybdenum cofactor assembly chaperone